MSLTLKARDLIKPLITIPYRGVRIKTKPRIKLGPWKYVPPPDSNPILVREESLLKSLVLENPNPKYPICIDRLDNIRKSPKGWLPRSVPPPELPFEARRNGMKRFNIETNHKKSKGRIVSYTTVFWIRGDLEALRDCLRWRFGENVWMEINEGRRSVTVAGYYPRQMSMLLQGLGF